MSYYNPNPDNAENLYTPDSIRTISGTYVNVFDPKPEMFNIEDIAHALSMQCRFGGHLPIFYSVAEHSMATARLCNDSMNFFSALMHDASEAYLLDIPSPIKAKLSNYKEVENGVMTVLAEKFGFEWPLSEEVKLADQKSLEHEWHTLHLEEAVGLTESPRRRVKDLFLQLFHQYKTYNDRQGIAI